MTRSNPVDICAAVVSHLPYDARVWKESRSLARAGYRVKLIGCRYEIDAPLRYDEDGIEVVEVPFGPREVSNRERATAGFLLWWEILRTPARAYHSHNIHVAPACWLAARLRGAALVYDAHELYGEPAGSSLFGRLQRRVSLLMERFITTSASAVITTNQSRVDVLRERHGRDDTVILPNVPALHAPDEPHANGFPPGRILLYQGGIYAETRSFRETLKAMRDLPGVEFVIVGFGRPRDLDLIRTWAEEEGVADRVHLLGPRPFDELVATAAAADVGLVPIKPVNWGTYLGDTNKLFEYLMAGLPVAAADLPEIRRIVEQGDPRVGELFDPFDADSIGAAIRAVLDDPHYAERRAEARRLAVEEHNWDIAGRRLLDLYARALPNGRAATSTQEVAPT